MKNIINKLINVASKLEDNGLSVLAEQVDSQIEQLVSLADDGSLSNVMDMLGVNLDNPMTGAKSLSDEETKEFKGEERKNSDVKPGTGVFVGGLAFTEREALEKFLNKYPDYKQETQKKLMFLLHKDEAQNLLAWQPLYSLLDQAVSHKVLN